MIQIMNSDSKKIELLEQQLHLANTGEKRKTEYINHLMKKINEYKKNERIHVQDKK